MEEIPNQTRVICNPASGGGEYDPQMVKDSLDGFEIEWIETQASGEAREAAEEWEEGLLIVIGGDGTINEVVNGLGKAGFPEGVTLALLPTGTGNDLAATLAVPEDPEEAIRTVQRARVRELDAASISSENNGTTYFINVATGGFGAEASSLNNEELKSKWGKLSYLRASLEVASKFEPRETTVTLDGKEREVLAVNVAVGNCRYAGGGWLAAPRANPEDGLLDLVVIEQTGMKGLLELAPTAFGEQDYASAEGVFYERARKLRIETLPSGLQFTADGEPVGDEPAEFEVIPKTLKIIVGEDYEPEVAPSKTSKTSKTSKDPSLEGAP